MPDFRGLFEAAPCSFLVLSPDLTIVAVSDAYLRDTMTKREEIVGRALFDAFPDDPDDPVATGVANLRASLREVLLHKRAHRMPVQRYPIRSPPEGGGAFEERYWNPLNTPVLNAHGDVEYIIHEVDDVTELVRLKHEKLLQDRNLHEIAKQSARYIQLLDSAPDATVIVAEDGRIRLVSAQAEKMFGYTRAELVGQPLDTLLPERFRRGHTLHMSRFFANPEARPMGSRLELFARRKDGSELPVEVSLSPQRGDSELTVSASIRDVTERRRLEAASRLNADRLASAVDTIEEAFALFDQDDRLVLCNSAYRRLLRETSPGALVGRSYAELLDTWMTQIDFANADARLEFRRQRLSQRRRSQTTSFEVRLLDGRKLRVSDRRTPEAGIVKTIWDLTDDERRSEELREARAAAEAASMAKSEFLSSMSHELRTPLNAILGFAQLMQRDRKEPLTERHRDRIAQVLHGGEHLLRLIDDVLDLARIEAGKLSLFIEPVDVGEILQEVCDILRPIAARQDIELTVERDGAGSSAVRADRTRLAQIVMNLGSNAIKYNRAGGRVTLKAELLDSSRVRIAVLDTGIGIPANKQHLLFQPFQRAGQESGAIEGTGIGLVTTKRLVTLMQGEIGFESTEGRGSRFWIDLPVFDQPAPVSERAQAPSAREPLPSERAQLLLYVEDNPANVSFMRDLIGTLVDVELVTVPTAEMGIELARARRPAAVIMDINLPNMSGLDALRILKSLPETAHIPVIALSAAASARDQQHGMEAGFFRYFTKPVNVDELLRALDELLSAPTVHG
ncbi:MAG TPA: PAS domain S-box protein [Polyangiales bacterium]|nr:PAS domain S-box protein [Polyangiales bacterium]